MEEFEGRRRGMVQPRQQHVATSVKGIEWGLGKRGLRMVVAFWVFCPPFTGGESNNHPYLIGDRNILTH